MQKYLWILLLVLGLSAAGVSVQAEDMMPGEMTAEQKEMMERFQAYQTVNENHALLKQLEGDWTAKIMHWMAPGAPAEEMMGAGAAQMTMGGRFLEQNFTGSYQGQPFVGRGVYGYDNIQQKFVSIWYDNMGTGIMMSYDSTYDPAAKKLTEEGNMSCPMTNNQRWYRAELTFGEDEDHYTYETFMKDENGEEYRAMLIEYTRDS